MIFSTTDVFADDVFEQPSGAVDIYSFDRVGLLEKEREGRGKFILQAVQLDSLGAVRGDIYPHISLIKYILDS